MVSRAFLDLRKPPGRDESCASSPRVTIDQAVARDPRSLLSAKSITQDHVPCIGYIGMESETIGEVKVENRISLYI